MNVPSDADSGLALALAAHAARIRPFGSRIVHLASVGSTNDVAGQLATDGAPEGTLVVADAQTAGRGRMGHAWYSPPLAGLYVSVVLRPPRAWLAAAPQSMALVTLAAGVALANGLRAACGLAAAIKWPNDVVVHRSDAASGARTWRKVAGILAEGAASGSELQHVVLGCGANLGRVAYPSEIASTASSIEEETGRPVDRTAVLVETLAALSHEYAALVAGDGDAVLARWRALSPSAEGAAVVWREGETQIAGMTSGVDRTGALLVRAPGGETRAIRAGEVIWL